MLYQGRRLTQTLVTIAAFAIFQIAPSKAFADASVYAVSATATAQNYATTFTNSSSFNGSYMFDTELWDANNNRVFQHYEVHDASDTSTFTLTEPLTAGLQNGTYTVKAGVFSANWQTKYLWSDQVTTITVGGSILTAYDATSTLNGNSLDTTFTSTTPFNGQYLFDVELWDSTNTRAYQYFDTFSVSSNSMTVSRDVPSSIKPGSYTAKVGIFLPNWSTKLLWSDKAGTITVGTAAPPATYTADAASTDNGVTFQTDFKSSRAVNGNYLFDVELWNTNNQRVYQSFDTMPMANANTMSVTRTVPTNIANGTYKIKAGWFTPNWAKSLVWNDNTGSLVTGLQPSKPSSSDSISVAPVQPAATMTTTTTSTTVPPTTTTTVAPTTTTTSTTSTTVAPTTTTTVAPTTTTTTAAPVTTTTTTTATPVVVVDTPLTFNASAVKTGSNFDTTFSSSKPMNDRYLFDVELWTTSGQRVYQYYETHDASSTPQAKVSQLVPSNIPAGTYIAKAGVFSPDWQTKYLWSENVGSIKVGAATTPVTNNNGPSGSTGNWNLVFGDDFNGSSLDANKWTTCSRELIYWKNTCMGHNSEQQSYDNSALSMVDFPEGGHGLRITAKPDGTWGFTHDDVPAGSPKYSSGMISTSPNTMNFNQPGYKPFDFTYGFYEVRMKAPKGQGLWPAAWAFPSDNNGPQELDLAEILGNDPGTTYMTVHYDGGGQSSLNSKAVDTSDGFHTYGIDWEPDHISWYIDGQIARSTFLQSGSIPNKQMYLMLNLAVGGEWPGAANSSTPFPASMDVDWVHVYKHS